MTAVETESLSKTYRTGFPRKTSVAALSGVSLAVDEGKIFGLLGPNGAGKTTFIKILLGLTHPSAGEATLLGVKLPDTRVKSRVGYLPENPRYPPYLNGLQVLELFGKLCGLSSHDARRKAPGLLATVGLEEWRTMKAKRFSKGMLQRLGLAQALINDPDILFLDEPTDGIDPVGRKEIRELLKRLSGEGKTIFLNSHLLSEVEMISDTVAILDRGRLLKVGTIDELTAAGSAYRITHEGLLPEELLLEAAALVIHIKDLDGTISVETNDAAELNRLIDLLRRHGITITSVLRVRSSLEDSFMHLIKREIPA
jgi:ABC-2 type transport system ATP-binding protein